MSSLGDMEQAAVSRADTGTQPTFRRVLVAVKDASQVEHAVELARRVGASEARVLHLSLRESIGGRRYPLESDASAAGLVEAAILELRLAGIPATGEVCYALIDRAAQAIAASAAEWGADLIVLGSPRRSKLTTRLFGGMTLRVQQHAECPVLVASPAGSDRRHVAEPKAAPVTAS
jgi:nucleotide-binding universal stress UspA family protein